jgi:hypothetical protein
MSQRSVRITPGDPIACNPDPVPVDKNVDTVQWTCSQDFSINLHGNGHASKAVQSGGNWISSAGPWDNTTGKKKKVKYSVTTGGVTTDPDVEVQP